LGAAVARQVAVEHRRPVIALGPGATADAVVTTIREHGGQAASISVAPDRPERFAEALAPVIDRWGCPDSLVIAADGDEPRCFHELTWSDWESAAATLLATVGLLRAVLPLILSTADDGVVVGVGPWIGGAEDEGCASALVSGALKGLGRALRAETAIHSVRWYWVDPQAGVALDRSSPLADGIPETVGDDAASLAARLATAPLHR
jgi:NAD(P)-dependent dehydrogenase (short-subunit alcohol dehydrogenase family)